MSTDYQPGTVAIVTDKFGRSGRGICNTKGGWDFTPEGADLSCFSSAGEIVAVHPLVVLDLDPTVLVEDIGARRNEAQRLVDMLRETADEFFTPDAAALARKAADQIEAQTKPPRIPEPGLWGVVEASPTTGSPAMRRWVRYGTGWRDAFGGSASWSDLLNPTLIREGVES